MKRNLIKKIALILVLVLAMCLSACGGQKKEIEEAVTGLMTALKAGDMQKAGTFIDAGGLEISDIDSLDGGDQVLEAVFSQLECKVLSSEKKGSDEAVVTAEITTLDLTAILGQSTMTVLQEFAMGEIQEEDIDRRTEEIFKEAIEKDNLATVTNETQILLKKTNAGWKVVADKTFQNAISGGFLGAVNDAQSALFKTAEE